MPTFNFNNPTMAPAGVRYIPTASEGPVPIAPLKLGPVDFAQLAAWLVEPVTPDAIDPRAVKCRWGKCNKTLNLSSDHNADIIEHLKYDHLDGPICSGNYRGLTCKWVGCGLYPTTSFKNNALAEEWIHGHVLEHSGVRAAKEGHMIERCVLCKRFIDGYRSRADHMRKCIAETPFLDTARDLETYGVLVCAFDASGEWMQVRVKATGDRIWTKDGAGRWVNPMSGRAA